MGIDLEAFDADGHALFLGDGNATWTADEHGIVSVVSFLGDTLNARAPGKTILRAHVADITGPLTVAVTD
jgi:hypothetical protein